MKMFNSYYHKNILKTSALLRASNSRYVIQIFILNNNSVKKNFNIQQVLFFSFLKKPDVENKTSALALKNH